MKKILFLINSLKIGGAEKAFVSQANGLLNMGFDVYFGVLEAKEETLNYLSQIRVAEKNYFCFNQKGLYDWRCYKKIAQTAKDKKIDVIYAPLPAASLAARVAKIFCPKLKIVVREANIAKVKSWKMKLADILLLPFRSKHCADRQFLFFLGRQITPAPSSVKSVL